MTGFSNRVNLITIPVVEKENKFQRIILTLAISLTKVLFYGFVPMDKHTGFRSFLSKIIYQI